MWEELLDDQHSCARGCWVATGLSRWMGCSDPQGSGRGPFSLHILEFGSFLAFSGLDLAP